MQRYKEYAVPVRINLGEEGYAEPAYSNKKRSLFVGIRGFCVPFLPKVDTHGNRVFLVPLQVPTGIAVVVVLTTPYKEDPTGFPTAGIEPGSHAL